MSKHISSLTFHQYNQKCDFGKKNRFTSNVCIYFFFYSLFIKHLVRPLLMNKERFVLCSFHFCWFNVSISLFARALLLAAIIPWLMTTKESWRTEATRHHKSLWSKMITWEDFIACAKKKKKREHQRLKIELFYRNARSHAINSLMGGLKIVEWVRACDFVHSIAFFFCFIVLYS